MSCSVPPVSQSGSLRRGSSDTGASVIASGVAQGGGLQAGVYVVAAAAETIIYHLRYQIAWCRDVVFVGLFVFISLFLNGFGVPTRHTTLINVRFGLKGLG